RSRQPPSCSKARTWAFSSDCSSSACCTGSCSGWRWSSRSGARSRGSRSDGESSRARERRKSPPRGGRRSEALSFLWDMRIGLAQIDTTVGAFEDNAAAIVRRSREAAEAGAQLAVFPELTLCGYPPKDLLALREFVERQLASLEQLARDPIFSRISALVGFTEPHRGEGAGHFNACALLRDGKVAAVARKSLLPTYDVFDAARYFDPSPEVTVVDVKGVRIGISICEDLWNDKLFWQSPRYARDPIDELARQGAQIPGNLSASPY